MSCQDIIHPTQTLQLHYLCDLDSKLRSLSYHRIVTFRKRPFPLAVLTNGVLSLWIPSMFVLTRPAFTVISLAGLRQLGLA